MQFTEDLGSVKDMISKSVAEGGDDNAEDVLGALDEALKFEFWAKTCLIFLICDAPCHGSQYHNNVFDKFKDQEINILERKMTKLRNLRSKNVFFNAFKIDKSTDKMFGIMKNYFGQNFTSTDTLIPAQFFDTMFDTMTK